MFSNTRYVLEPSTHSYNSALVPSFPYNLTTGSWNLNDNSLRGSSGTCVSDNGPGNITDAELWSVCGLRLAPLSSFEVSTYPNGSYALAGSFPIEFDNALGIEPSLTETPYYQFPVKFTTVAGSCEAFMTVTVDLGRKKELFQIHV